MDMSRLAPALEARRQTLCAAHESTLPEALTAEVGSHLRLAAKHSAMSQACITCPTMEITLKKFPGISAFSHLPAAGGTHAPQADRRQREQ